MDANIFEQPKQYINNRIMLKNRFRETRLAAGITQRVLAEWAGTDQPTISDIEKGRVLRPRKIETFAKLLKVSPQWLLFGEDKQANEPPNSYNIPVFANHNKDTETNLALSMKPVCKQWIKDNSFIADDLVVVKINDESMTPRICKGDLLIVDTTNRRFLSGQVYAIDVNGDIHIKRMHQRISGDWLMASDNAAYPPETLTITELVDLDVVGRVVSILTGKI